MLRSTLYRTFFAVSLFSAVLPAGARSQSQDSESVADAARRAREQKKSAAKSAKVITDDTLDVKKGDVQSATADVPKIAGAPEVKAPVTGGAASASAPKENAGGSSSKSNDEKIERQRKELAALQEQLKVALTDLDLLRRENRLDQETYYSKPNYGADAAGKQKLDDEVQHINDKQQEVDNLKAKIADLEKTLGSSSAASSQP